MRQGLKDGVEAGLLLAGVRAFHQEHLLVHFAVEEEVVFPVLDAHDPLVVRALAEHRRITHLTLMEPDTVTTLSCLVEELQAHVRFEERVLFPRVQEVATTAQLERIEQVHGALTPG
jgi:iron-sulfur cluster repair protein YtfE (RIC family)